MPFFLLYLYCIPLGLHQLHFVLWNNIEKLEYCLLDNHNIGLFNFVTGVVTDSFLVVLTHLLTHSQYSHVKKKKTGVCLAYICKHMFFYFFSNRLYCENDVRVSLWMTTNEMIMPFPSLPLPLPPVSTPTPCFFTP